MKRNETFELVLTSFFVALIFLMGFIPGLGFITLMPGNETTILHIPVLIAAVLFRRKYAFIPALAFGVVSLIQGSLNQVGFTGAFINPMISIIPRLLFAVAVHYLFKHTRKLVDNSRAYAILLVVIGLVTSVTIFFGANFIFSSLDQIWRYLIAVVIILAIGALYYHLYRKHSYKALLIPSIFILGTLIHTILVLSFAAVFAYDILEALIPDANVIETIFMITYFNGILEAVAAAFIGTPIYLVLSKLPIVELRLLND
ncbi:hypothetical protein JV173_02820 [Acholeplasma equirhinis]|uniref:hypothetical protein n=1 Tax=Acholeplasma equirhinis TaxID=555393 RepID=UPI00197ACF07|nr:hypothetical protein [Acholeplasma equirhinis]MBN3490441.1 hypothetical protein [Acholeplasma equirhinis]